MTDSPLVSVSVIVRTMWRPTLSRTIAAVAAQSYANLETVIVDAEGTGPRPGVVGRNLRVVSDGRPHQRAEAANIGVLHARGANLVLLDDDDTFGPTHIERLARSLAGSACHAAYTDAEAVDARGEVIKVFDRPWSHVRLHHGNLFPLHAVMFARATVDAGCRFDPSLALLEDWDFWLQVAEHTAFLHVPGKSATYHIVDGASGAGALGNYDAGQADAATNQVAKRWRERRQQLLEELWARREQAFHLIGAGQFAEAEPDLHAALAFDENDTDAMSMLARCAIAGARTIDAIALLERAVGADPRRTELKLNLALALEQAGRVAEARGLLEGVAAHSPGYAAAQRVLLRLVSGGGA